MAKKKPIEKTPKKKPTEVSDKEAWKKFDKMMGKIKKK